MVRLRTLAEVVRDALQPDTEAAIDSRKRQIYLLIVPIGALFALADALQQRLYQTGSAFNLAADILLACSLYLLAILVWRGVISQRRFELGVFFLTVAFILANFFFEVWTGGAGEIPQIIKWAPWLELVYIISFLTFEPNESLLLSALLSGGMLAIGLLVVVPDWLAGRSGGGFYLLFQFGAASLITFIFLYQIGGLRQRYALTDFLTGVANRRQMYDYLARELEKAQRYEQALSVLICDLDYFKTINDTHGHQSGDLVLKGIAELLTNGLRRVDNLARWGGEEFLVALPLTSGPGALKVAERLRATLAGHLFPRVGQVTGSFGVASYRPGDTLEELLHRCDQALYRAKQAGRNRVVDDRAIAAVQENASVEA